MSEHQPGDGETLQNTAIAIETGDCVAMGEGLIVYVHGPSTEGIRVSDSRGWTAVGDIRDGVVETAWADGIRSEGEDLALETAEILVRRLNARGEPWGAPVELEAHVGRGVDCEARDKHDPRRPLLRVQVTRPKMPKGFWKTLAHGSNMPPGPAVEAAGILWEAINAEKKRHRAQHDVVLALNTIRTPWLALPSVVQAFRKLYGEAASRQGWEAIWVVGVNETFTERLDRPAEV